MLKAAGSTPDNIAEGYCRNTLGDYIRFCEIAWLFGRIGQPDSALRALALASGATPGRLSSACTATLPIISNNSSRAYMPNETSGAWNRDLTIREPSGFYDIAPPETIELPEAFDSPTGSDIS